MASKQDENKQGWLTGSASKRLVACLICGLLSALLWWLPGTQNLLQRGMRAIQDHRAGNDVRLRPREDFVFLGIDASSLKLDGLDPSLVEGVPTLKKMKSQWPWDRRIHADVIDRLANAGARLIVIDLLFIQPATPEEDEALRQAISRHRDKVVLASVFMPQSDKVQMLEPIDPFLGPLDDETSVGFVNFWPHAEDRLVKRPIFERTLNEANGDDPHPDEPVFKSLAAAAADRLGVTLPDADKRFRMARIKGESVSHVYSPESLYTIFVPDDWTKKYGDGEYFRDKVVFVGPAAPTFQDNHDTTAGQIYGAQLHMHVLGAILDDAWYEEGAFGGGGMYFVFLSALGLVIAGLFVIRWGKTLLMAGAVVCGVLVWYLAEIFAVHLNDRLLGSLAFSTTFASSVLGAIIWQAMSERAQRQQLHRHLRRSMSPDVADAIVRAPEGYYMAASGNRREVTVLFTDIRGFTSRSEEQDAGELVAQLNTYLERMVDVIFRHGGTVDKFIGDAIMATWGALGESDSTAQVRQAADASREMLDVLRELNSTWKEEGKRPFRIGIGIHHGEAIVGEVGSDQRTDFTAIGDAVNLASRIEGLTKAFGVDLLVSGSVSEMLENNDDWIGIAQVRVKGRDGGVSLSMPVSKIPEENDAICSLRESYLSGNWKAARDAAQKLKNETHFAGVARFYLKLLDQSDAPEAGWDGLITMQTK